MNKKKKQANKKHQRTKSRVKALKDISLKKKKKIIAKPKAVDEKNNDVVEAKDMPDKKAPAKKAPAKKSPAKKTPAKKATAKKPATKKK